MAKEKIFCHTCDGIGWISEKRYLDGKTIDVVCPECDGKRYVEVDLRP